MAKSVLDAPHFKDEEAAYAWVEARVWPNGPVCPHCGGFDRISKMKGKSTRLGVYKCYQCRKQFTVKVGTVFEDSHVPMNLWLQGNPTQAVDRANLTVKEAASLDHPVTLSTALIWAACVFLWTGDLRSAE